MTEPSSTPASGPAPLQRPADAVPAAAPFRGPRRRRALLAVSALVAAAALGLLAYQQQVASRYVSTDNAYVQGRLVQVTPQIGGTVTAVLADDTAFVKAGQPLVRLDPADAKVALQQAEAALALAVRQAPPDGAPVETHPGVQLAAARLREAWLATQRLTITAPVDGQVARRSVQLGQRVAAGTPLMTVVPLDQVWVDANFKEVQLGQLRLGQPVTLTADLYGPQVTYRGTVAGLSAGTGAAFALLPAQNATGNWIKVVQRVPVRIALDPQEVAAHPLRVGLSMHAEVDVSRQDGQRLEAPKGAGPAETASLAIDVAGADALVRRVIAAHLGAASARLPRPGAAGAGAR